MFHKESVGTVCLTFCKQQFAAISLALKRRREYKICCLPHIIGTQYSKGGNLSILPLVRGTDFLLPQRCKSAPILSYHFS